MPPARRRRAARAGSQRSRRFGLPGTERKRRVRRGGDLDLVVGHPPGFPLHGTPNPDRRVSPRGRGSGRGVRCAHGGPPPHGWISRSCSRPSRTRRRSPPPMSSASASRRRWVRARCRSSSPTSAATRSSGSATPAAAQPRARKAARPPSGCRWRAARTAARSPRRRSRSKTGADGTRVFAPVTNRGEAIGVLELSLREAPDEQTVADVALARARAGLRRHRQPPVHRPLRVGPALGSAVAGRRDPASPAAGLLHLRGRAVHARGLAGARRRRRRRHLRLRAGARHAASLDDRRHGPRGRRRPARHRAGRGAAQRAPRRASDSPSRRAWPTPDSPTTPATAGS